MPVGSDALYSMMHQWCDDRVLPGSVCETDDRAHRLLESLEVAVPFADICASDCQTQHAACVQKTRSNAADILNHVGFCLPGSDSVQYASLSREKNKTRGDNHLAARGKDDGSDITAVRSTPTRTAQLPEG